MRGPLAPLLLAPLALVGCANGSRATDYYVAQEDAQASDANPGALERPFRTLGRACEVATAGYWVRADGEHYLLLDVAAPTELRFTGSGAPVLWDFPVLRAPVSVPLIRVGEALTAQVEGPCALIVGLGDDAHPAAME